MVNTYWINLLLIIYRTNVLLLCFWKVFVGYASGNRRVILSDAQIMIMNSEQNIKKNLFDSDHKQTTEGGWSLKEGTALPEICDYMFCFGFVWRYFQVHQLRVARTQVESYSEIGLRIG